MWVAGRLDELDVRGKPTHIDDAMIYLDIDPRTGERNTFDPQRSDLIGDHRREPGLAVGNPGIQAQQSPQAQER